MGSINKAWGKVTYKFNIQIFAVVGHVINQEEPKLDFIQSFIS